MIIMKDTIEINAPAEKVYEKLITYMSNAGAYRSWHPEHVDITWLKGEPMKVGSIMRADEYLREILYKLKFKIIKVIPGKYIFYRPLFPLSIIATGNSFSIETKDENTCIFTAEGRIRMSMKFFINMHKAHEGKLKASQQHMKEEGENIKKAVEDRDE